MKKIPSIIFLAILIFSAPANAASVTLNDKIQFIFSDLNPQSWTLSENQFDKDKQAGMYVFKHSAIKNGQGQNIFPTIGIVYETVPANVTDVVNYSANKRRTSHFKVDKVLTNLDGSMTYENAVGYIGSYVDNGIKHKLWIAHMLYENIGIQVIADGTSDVFDKIQPDVATFFKSMNFEKK